MQVKLIEIRDSATFIPAVAIKMFPRNDQEDFLLGRSGFGPSSPFVLLTRLEGGKCFYEPCDWADRTFQTAHKWLMDNWETFQSGDVIDVQFILGETKEPKRSELLDQEDKIDVRDHVDEL